MDMRQKLFEKYRTKHSCKRFVETGTYKGTGIRAALAAGFTTIHSFDPNTECADAARREFGLKITQHNASSLSAQFVRLAQARTRALFWLDAHRMDRHGKGLDDYPLRMELAIVAAAPVAHVVLCDDVRLFGRYGLTIDDALAIISEFRSYCFAFETAKLPFLNDVLALWPGAPGKADGKTNKAKGIES